MNRSIIMSSSTMNISANQVPEWVSEMQSHFARTGSYRPEDICRVLGNPGDVMTLPAGEPGFFAASATGANKPADK